MNAVPPAPFKQKYEVRARYLSAPSQRRSGRPIDLGVKFVVAHDTGNPGSTAAGNVGYYERTRNEESASAHLFVDDRDILECIPALTGKPEKAWHVRYREPSERLYGFDANDAAVGVEYCYGDEIDPDEAYRRYVWVMAAVCYTFHLDPATSVVGHFFLDPMRRTDPVTGLARSRRTYEQLLRDVAAEFADCAGAGPAGAPDDFVSHPGTATTTVRLNVRRGQPNRRAEVVRVVPVGTPLVYVGWVASGEPVNGNARWYRDVNGNYFWSGGLR